MPDRSLELTGETRQPLAAPGPPGAGIWLALWLLAFALLSRFSVFGDTNYFNDEYFYFQGGLRLWQGQLPYVDVWDRKGPGLFLTYALAGAFSSSVIAYQVAALLFAAATAYVISLIARHFTTASAAALGSTLYLVLLVFFGGGGGQSPVFYNFWMALAALGLVKAMPAVDRGEAPPVLFGAMLAAGIVLTFKQTAIFECLYFGGFALWRLVRGGMPASRLAFTVIGMAALGIAPMALFAMFYAGAGHFAEFWHAMVTANLAKSYNPAGDAGRRIATLAMLFAPALLPALIGAALPPQNPLAPRWFIACWLAAALAGFAAVPNFYEHYLLPVCLPVSLAAGCAFGLHRTGRIAGVAVIAFGLMLGPAFDFASRSASREGMAAFASVIRASAPEPRLLVFEGPVDLYRQVGVYPPSPLYYPLHLYFPAEHDVSHIGTADAVRKILAWRPTAIILYPDFPAREENQASAPLVHAYLAAHCKLATTRRLPEVYTAHLVALWTCDR